MPVLNHDNLFYDIKKVNDIREKPLDRIMTFFSGGNQDIENSKFTESAYAFLGFDNYNKFDVINSFWNVFLCGLAITNEFLAEEKKLRRCYYEFSDNNKSVQLNKSYIKKSYFANNYLKRSENSDIKIIVRNLQDNYPQINELASVCHAVVNFAPCPASSFNMAKGQCADVKDFLPLMINKIEKCIETTEELKYDNNSIDVATLKEYKMWLIENREKCYLQEFFQINENGKMIGTPFFKGQSLEKPLPTNANELRSCLDNILKTLHNRSILILNKL
ncbi:hypothetical protein [Rossellomorea sp. DA94]|uniref:hypothetical protein n=1 Tax=Rossellomorea sp. DA94 TaxID=3038653 RepID=UPI00244CF612|nr:hypothetical protein [Rossellomorea sp. DA94]WGG47703.1 hypothetical protein P8596_11035 [Rossellomorea sp. DA94]